MNKILVIGAGKSSGMLIEYLSKHANGALAVTVADESEELAREKTQNMSSTQAVPFDVTDEVLRKSLIGANDLVISLLPPHLHVSVAKECVALRKHLITASYTSEDMRALHKDAENAGIIILTECGFDPGIDHMSAMRVIDRLKQKNAVISSFKSFAGGLIAPESDDNLWHYKFTWNPRNVVLAGQGVAKYLETGHCRYVPYHRLFKSPEQVSITGFGDFEAYPNRDSLSYREPYDLGEIPTILRGTLRRPGFCAAWDIFVQLGLTDDSVIVEHSETMSYREFLVAWLGGNINDAETTFARTAGIERDSHTMKMIAETGLFREESIGIKKATSARIFQKLLEAAWKLQEGDKDMVVMQHIFDYLEQGKSYRLTSSLGLRGESQRKTAMAKTVGYPPAIAAKLILEGFITLKGVRLPVAKQIYDPVLAGLEKENIIFQEKIVQNH